MDGGFLFIRKATPTNFLLVLLQQPEHISQYYTQIDFHTVPIQIYEQLKTTGNILIATDVPYHSKDLWVLFWQMQKEQYY